MDQSNTQVLEIYKQITAKLKKRSFFRKANFSEAIEAYSELLKTLRRQEEEEYSGLVSVAIAKCHQQQNNQLMEALYYHRAGKYFMNFQTNLRMTNSPTYQESAELAIECYQAAIEIYESLKYISKTASLFYELGQFLLCMNRSTEAGQYYEKAAELQQADNAMSAIISLKKAFQCYIKNQNYLQGMQLLQWIIKISTEQATLNSDPFYLDIIIESSITNVLLLILTGDFQQAKININHLQKEHGEKKSKYSSNNDNNHLYADLYFTNDIYFVLLEALIESVENANESEIIKIQCELKNELTPVQNELFLRLLKSSKSHNS